MKTDSRQDMDPQVEAAILHAVGPADPAMLRALANDIQSEGTWMFGNIHAERLRMLADKLDAGTGTDAVRAQAMALLDIWHERVAAGQISHEVSVSMLTAMLRDLAETAERAGRQIGGKSPITFVFTRCENCGHTATAVVLDAEIASELAMLFALVNDGDLKVEVAA